jgi:4-amino-4-deoxy-L-arabinose transferase-like glycosyltransferase
LPPLAVLLALALPVLFVALDANSIWDANEAFYVETPRQMVLTGDYVVPTFNAEPRTNKPVLSYWVVAALYRVFGISVAVERFGIALGALGIVLAAFLVGRAVRSTTTGLLAALVVVTAPRFVFWARRIFIDIWITCFMALTLACFALAERFPQHRRALLVGMYVAIGLGTLTKGPMAFLLPGGVIFVWLLTERRLGDIRRLMLLPGAAIVLAIVAPWYVALYQQRGWDPIVEFWIGENVGRFTEAMVPDGRGPDFYLPVLLTDLFPWAPLVLVPLATIAMTFRRATAPAIDATGDAIRRLLWWWVVVIVGGFSLSETKQDLYIFPAVPAVAALVADLLERGWRQSPSRAAGGLFVGVCVVCLVLAAALVGLLGPAGGPWALAGVVPAAAALGGGGLAAGAAWLIGRHRMAIVLLAGAFVAFNYAAVVVVYPDLERFKPTPAIAAAFRDRAGPQAVLAHYRQSLPSLVYYADHPVIELPSLDAAVERLSTDPGGGEIWILMGDGDARLALARATSACEALRHPTILDLRLRQMLDGTPASSVVLLTNRCR